MSDLHEASSMQGHGFYNRNSAMQAAGIELLIPLWESLCKTVSLPATHPVIVDYGCSQGRNSMAPMRIAVEELRSRVGMELPIEIIHVDRPSNDFSSLFEALQDTSVSYMAGLNGIFPSAVGRSYFEQIVPPGRVLLGWNSWTMQWMSGNPIDAPDFIIPGMSHNPSVLQAVDARLASDWMQFLQLRAIEMCSGAKLLSAVVGRETHETGWEWLLGELWASIQDMAAVGLLSDHEQLKITVPVSPRRLEDIEAPFGQDRRVAGLFLEHAEIIRVPDAFWDDYQHSGDALQLGRRHADATRAWAGPTIAERIDPGPDRTALVDDLFARFAARIAANPQKHEPYLGVAVLHKEA